jgi:acetyltransferase-like isoleucine patch superfamily enzyme
MSNSNAATARGRFHRIVDRIRGSVRHRAIDRVGRGTIIAGCLDVENNGTIQIGEDCHIGSHPIQSHLVAMDDARISIGDRVFISYGAAMSATRSIQIGDDTRIGPFSLILDNDYHRVGNRESPGVIAPIDIGRNVLIGTRVTILRGARIGDGACVMSGSTVAGIIASRAVVAGVPARVGGDGSMRDTGRSVASIIMRLFGLAAAPSPLDGPAQIAGWTRIGSIRLSLALEEAFGVTIPEEQIHLASNVAEVSRLVALAREGNAQQPRSGMKRGRDCAV